MDLGKNTFLLNNHFLYCCPLISLKLYFGCESKYTIQYKIHPARDLYRIGVLNIGNKNVFFILGTSTKAQKISRPIGKCHWSSGNGVFYLWGQRRCQPIDEQIEVKAFGGIQQLRGQKFAIFCPPPPCVLNGVLRGHFLGIKM